MKKFIIILLCLSSLGFAKSPLRHRVAATQPDAVVLDAATQHSMREMLRTAPIAGTTPTVSAFADKITATITRDLIATAKNHLGLIVSRQVGEHVDGHGLGKHSEDDYRLLHAEVFQDVFQHLGITLKRSSQEQHTQGEAIGRDALQPGDLVFFGRGGKGVNHVGIVTHVNAEDNTFNFIHASTSRGVRIDSSSDGYWTRRYTGARRIIGCD